MAEHAYRLRSFNTLAEIITGLSHRTVERLPRQAWEALDETTRNSLARLSSLCSPLQNYSGYRASMTSFLKHSSSGEAAIPLMPVLLRDMTFIIDGNPDLTTEGGVNWEKVELLGAQLATVETLKRISYPFRYRRDVIQSLLSAAPLNEMELDAQLAYINERVRKHPSTILRTHSSDEPQVNVDEILLRSVSSWTTYEAAAWMRSIGMNEWTSSLLDAGIDGATLLTLTDEQMVVVLGMTKLGVRKRFQRHIQAALEHKAFLTDESFNTDETHSQIELTKLLLLHTWNPEQVKAWLRSIGYGTVLHCFHHVTGRQLVELTEPVLLELGVERSSTRRRLMREIRKLQRRYESSDDSSMSSNSPRSVSSSPEAEARRSSIASASSSLRDPRSWSNEDVLAFLDKNDLGQHRHAFSTAGVRGDRLVTMSESDFLAMGLTKLGHRMRLLRALKELNSLTEIA